MSTCSHLDSLNLNFENGWDQWYQDKEDDFDWELRSTGSPTARTGPLRDHTTGKGMALESQFTEESL